MKIISLPETLLALGILFTIFAVIATGLGTIRSYKLQANEQAEIAKLNKKLREKAEENSLLNSQIANLQINFVEKSANQLLTSQGEIKDKIDNLKTHESKLANKIEGHSHLS